MDSYCIVPYFTAAYLIFSTPLSITGESIDCIEVNGTDILTAMGRHKANRADHFRQINNRRIYWKTCRITTSHSATLSRIDSRVYLTPHSNWFFLQSWNPFISVFTINASKSFRAWLSCVPIPLKATSP
jgi:hypothetical protein